MLRKVTNEYADLLRRKGEEHETAYRARRVMTHRTDFVFGRAEGAEPGPYRPAASGDSLEAVVTR